MFGPVFFGPRYFGPRYFGHGGTVVRAPYFGHAYFGRSFWGDRYFPGNQPVTVTLEKAPYWAHAYFGRTFWGDRYFPGNAFVIVTPPSRPSVGGGAHVHRPRLAPEIVAVLRTLDLPALQFRARVSALPADISARLQAELPRLLLEGLVGDVSPADMEALSVALGLAPQRFSADVNMAQSGKRWTQRQDEDELEAHYLACLALMGKDDA
jgi:hypothetical protein